MTLYILLIFFVTYFICSINPAIIICKLKTGEDIRKLGSGNAGSANAMRVLGKVLGTFVVLLDIAKVYLSYFIASYITKKFGYTTEMTTFKNVFILAGILGHCFPVYYKFKGGKGVVVGMTLMIILDTKHVLICIVVALVIMAITRTVSRGTIVGTILYFLISLFTKSDCIIVVFICTCIVLFKHRTSIERILARQEKRF